MMVQCRAAFLGLALLCARAVVSKQLVHLEPGEDLNASLGNTLADVPEDAEKPHQEAPTDAAPVLVEEARVLQPTTVTIVPTSITVGTATEITFEGVSDGDKVEFTLGECNTIKDDPNTIEYEGPESTVRGGTATINVPTPGTGLKLCLLSQSGLPIMEIGGVSLDVIARTSPTAITSTNRAGLARGLTSTITLAGSEHKSMATFIPIAKGCASATLDVQIDAHSQGSFTIPSSSETGDYKLCYQAPGGSDSVEQSGSIRLEVLDVIKTPVDLISAIYPGLITVNVATMLTLTGATAGDKAAFVNSASRNCSSVTPETDVGAGHAMFTIISSGEYTLCYQVYGAQDSVAQKLATVNVKAPGVTQAMINRWQSKNGQVDCTQFTYVPTCSMGSKTDCSKTYMIDSGVGYTCDWDDVKRWPGKCVMTGGTNTANICQSGKCANKACW